MRQAWSGSGLGMVWEWSGSGLGVVSQGIMLCDYWMVGHRWKTVVRCLCVCLTIDGTLWGTGGWLQFVMDYGLVFKVNTLT